MREDTSIIVVPGDVEMTVHVDYDAPPLYADRVLVTDEIAFELIQNLNLNDAVVVTDEAMPSPVYIRVFADAVAVTDSFGRTGDFSISFADAVTVSEQINASMAGNFNINLADTVTVADAISPALTTVLSFADSVAMSDAITGLARTYALGLADNVAMRDEVTVGDLNWSSVTFLLHGNGTAFTNNYYHYDSSPNAFPVTVGGYVRQGAVSPYQGVGGSSWFGDGGSLDFLQLPNSTFWNFGNGPFTVECWFYAKTPVPGFMSVISQWNSGGQPGNAWLLAVSSLIPNFFMSSDGLNATTIATGPAVVADQWNHIAAVRNGNTLTVYTNGVAGTGVTVTVAHLASSELLGIGWRRNTGSAGSPAPDPIYGFLSDVRIMKGTPLYVANFTPPVAPLPAIGSHLLLSFQAASMVDSVRRSQVAVGGNCYPTPAQYKWASSSIIFNGTADYLTTRPYISWAFGTTDFTMECWFYIAGNSAPDGSGNRHACLISAVNGAADTDFWVFNIYGDATTTGLGFFIEKKTASVSEAIYSDGVTITQGVWHHVAVARVGANTRFFYDGALLGTKVLTNQNLTANGNLMIGRMEFASYERLFSGYLDEVRVTKGVGRYTANFPVPQGRFANGLPTGIPPVPMATLVSSVGFVSAIGANAKTVTFASAAVGDLAFIHLAYAGTGFAGGPISSNGGGWNQTDTAASAYGIYVSTFWKVLNAADVASGVAVPFTGLEPGNGTILQVTVYRGATSAALISTVAPATNVSTLQFAGFTKNAAHRGVYACCSDRDNAANFIPPANFTQRGPYTSDVYFRILAADILVPGSYVDGTVSTWTAFGATYPQVGFLYELRG
jgi:hypothetical protein